MALTVYPARVKQVSTCAEGCSHCGTSVAHAQETAVIDIQPHTAGLTSKKRKKQLVIPLIFFLFLGITITLAGHAESRLDLKGVPLGADEKTIKKAFPNFVCKDGDGITDDRLCSEPVEFGSDPFTFAGERAYPYFYLYRDRLERIDITLPELSSYGAAVEALEQKYGKPVRTKKQVSEDTGVFDSTVNEWKAGTDSIVAYKIVSRERMIIFGIPKLIGKAEIYYLSAGYRSELKRREAVNIRKRSKDL